MAISRISFAVLLTCENGVITRCATAFGAVSDVIDSKEFSDATLVGMTVVKAKDEKSAYMQAFDAAIVPIRGRVSSEYKNKQVALMLISRNIT